MLKSAHKPFNVVAMFFSYKICVPCLAPKYSDAVAQTNVSIIVWIGNIDRFMTRGNSTTMWNYAIVRTDTAMPTAYPKNIAAHVFAISS